MKFVKGNILDAKHGIIAHQVNCRLVMASGLAKQIRKKYPIVYTEYRNVMGSAPFETRLGKCQLVYVSPNFYVANLFGQLNYGRGKQHTDYNALALSLASLQQWRNNYYPDKNQMPLYLPSYIGCGLGGGDWNIVKGIIENTVPDAYIVRYYKEEI